MTRFLPLFAVVLVFLSACSSKQMKPFSVGEALSSLDAQARSVKTMRGTAWVTVRTPGSKRSFKAVLVVDRRDIKRPLLRMEIVDPFGAAHALVILDKTTSLSWRDLDQNKTRVWQGEWQGLPVAGLPDMLLGLSVAPDAKNASAPQDDHFQVRAGNKSLRYIMTWIDPGPRLALGGIEASWSRQPGKTESYGVHYSKFLEKEDFYVPRQVDIDARGPEEMKLGLDWGDRTWNDDLPGELFELPR